MTKGKIFLIIGILILLVSVPVAVFILKQKTGFRLGAQKSDRPENVQIKNITNQTATLTWTTSKASQGFISYGISPTNLSLIQSENAPTTNHQVNLTGLLPETNYFFVINVGEKTFDNNGQPYTFKTQPKETKEKPLAPSPTPTVSASLSEEKLKATMGTSNPLYDLNKDGIVNTLDLLLFRQQSK